MIGSMPQVIEGIEHQNGKDELGNANQSDCSDQAPALLLEPYRPEQKGYKNQGPHQDGVGRCQRAVAQPAKRPWTQPPPCRPQGLQKSEQRKTDQKDPEPSLIEIEKHGVCSGRARTVWGEASQLPAPRGSPN